MRLFWSAVFAAALSFSVGCQSSAPPVVEKPEHDHPTVGPHKGELIELGKEEFHAELVHNDDTHTISIYLLDDHAKEPVATDSKEVVVKLVVGGEPKEFIVPAKPQAGDAEGKATLFELVDEPLCKALDDGAKGRLNISVNGKDFVGEIEKHDHAHGHKH